MGCEQLWILKAALDEPLKDEPLKDEPLKDEPLKDEPLKDEQLCQQTSAGRRDSTNPPSPELSTRRGTISAHAHESLPVRQ